MSRRPGSTQGRLVTFAVKAVVSFGLIYWMAQSGKLSGASISQLIDSRGLLLATLATWLLVTVGLSTLRWMFLLKSYGIQLSAGRAGLLQMMGLFFNIVVPGNVSGDVLKNLYVPHRSMTNVAMIALIERLMGLVALIWIACALALFDISHVLGNPKLRVVLLGLSLVVGLSIVVPVALDRWARQRPAHAPAPTSRTVLRLVSEFMSSLAGLARSNAGKLGAAFAASLAMHAGNLLYFFLIARTITNPSANLSAVALVFPLGMLTLILPVSLSGLGVGHAAFEELFSWVGLSNGADTFNVFIVGVLGPCLLGALPSLFLRRESKPVVLPDPRDG